MTQLVQSLTFRNYDPPMHVTNIWVKIKGFDKRMMFGVYLYKGQYHAYEPLMNYTIPMYKGPVDAKEGDKLNRVVTIIRERVKMGLENTIAEKGLNRVIKALRQPVPQLQKLEI